MVPFTQNMVNMIFFKAKIYCYMNGGCLKPNG